MPDMRSGMLDDAMFKLAQIRDEPRFELLLPSEADAVLRALADRQQDKQRNERLEKALRELVSAGNERASLSDSATSSDNPTVRREATRIRGAFVDALDAAALAVEEDAE